MSEAMDVDVAPVAPETRGDVVEGGEEIPASQGGAPQRKKRFEIKKWTAVAFWAWDQKNETCAICRNFLMDGCIECASKSSEEMRCPRATGICNHSFHLHCISQWIKTRNSCPLDNKTWEMKEVNEL